MGLLDLMTDQVLGSLGGTNDPTQDGAMQIIAELLGNRNDTNLHSIV